MKTEMVDNYFRKKSPILNLIKISLSVRVDSCMRWKITSSTSHQLSMNSPYFSTTGMRLLSCHGVRSACKGLHLIMKHIKIKMLFMYGIFAENKAFCCVPYRRFVSDYLKCLATNVKLLCCIVD
jgi:hypothetical protein